MNQIEKKLKALGFILPNEIQTVKNISLPFSWVKVIGNRAMISGHLPLNTDGTLAEPLGKVGKDLTVEQGYHAAKLTALSILSSLKRKIGDLDLIQSWGRVFGMVNTSDKFVLYPAVINGFSDFILDLFGEDIGQHSRSAIGVAGLPFNCPVEIEAEVLLKN